MNGANQFLIREGECDNSYCCVGNGLISHRTIISLQMANKIISFKDYIHLFFSVHNF